MSHYSFIGDVDTDFETAANWRPLVVPVNGDSWQADDRAVNGILLGLDQSAKTFSRVSFDGMKHPIGNSTADPLKCDITALYAHGSEARQIFLQGAVVSCFARLAGANVDGLVIDGAVTNLSLTAGRMRLRGSNTMPTSSRFEVNARARVNGGVPSFDSAILTIEDEVDLTTNDTRLVAEQGTIQCNADCDDVVVGNGLFIIGESDAATPVGANMPLVEMFGFGGVCRWLGRDSTLTQAHIHAGRLHTDEEHDYPRTLVNASVWGNGVLDLRTGVNTTFSNAIKKYGGDVFVPDGVSVTIAA